jgi:hypothetical protein
MIETHFTEQQVNAIITMKKKSNMVLNVFLWTWRIIGIVAIIGLIWNFFISPGEDVDTMEHMVNIITGVVGIFVAGGFLIGIPTLISFIGKRYVKKLQKGDYKVYIGVVTDKHKTRHDRKNTYSIYIKEHNLPIRVSSMNFDTMFVGQQIYVLKVGNQFDCYSKEFLTRCVNELN